MRSHNQTLRRLETGPSITIVLTALLIGVGAVCIAGASGSPDDGARGDLPADVNGDATEPATSSSVDAVAAASVDVVGGPIVATDAAAPTTSSPVADNSDDRDNVDPTDEAGEGEDFAPAVAPTIDLLAEPTTFGGTGSSGASWATLDLQPAGSQASPSPCDLAASQGQTILVTPDAVTLPAAASHFELTITYCGPSASTLTPAAGPGMAGDWKQPPVMQPGETQTATVHVHREDFPVGGFSSHVDFADQHGAETTVPVAGVAFGKFGAAQVSTSLTAGVGAPGCSAACITSAQLTPGLGIADLGLDVETNTPATLSVHLFNQPPMFIDGQPSAAGATPSATSDTLTTSWTTGLDTLQPDTTYHLVIEATDAEQRSHRVVHSFTTLAPQASSFTGNDAEPGCAAGCVTAAQLMATDSFDTVGLHVETHTPAKVVAQVGTGVTWDNGWPIVSGAITDATFNDFVTSWDATFVSLAPETDYIVVVRATDDNGKTDFRVGEFTTAAAPPIDVRVRFEKVLVRWDADSSPINRGELRFAWGIDDLRVGTRGESKHIGGDQITLESDTDGWLVSFTDDEAHLFTLAGGERDPKGVGFVCEAFKSPPGISRWRVQDHHDCDNVKWNTAPMSMTADDIDKLPWCSEYGIDGAAGNRKCHDVDSPNFGDDVPRFAAIVSFDVVN